IPRVEELVRLQDDVSRSGRDPEDDIRGVAAGNQRRSTKGAYVLPAENQRIPRFGRDLRPSSERIHRETCEALPALRFHHIDGERLVESTDHHVNDRYNSRVLAAIRPQVKSLRTCRRPAVPIFAPVAGSSRIRVIARPSFAGSPGGTRRPVPSSTTPYLLPPTRVATTGVSHAI